LLLGFHQIEMRADDGDNEENFEAALLYYASILKISKMTWTRMLATMTLMFLMRRR
jgi:hypothetical protein